MERYIGMGVSLKETSICVVDDDGEIRCEGTVNRPGFPGELEAQQSGGFIMGR